ncbi:hypothetical protein GF374_01280 [Candidatus Woesearchaeota archaeon]|nr:hypothetical protein [Candidatus Woesearchaeota archaeon]
MAGRKRGRSLGSPIRDNLIELLHFVGPSYGYYLYKKYKKVFGDVSLRSIYHHLSKGVELGLFEVKGVEKAKGDYSWGAGVQRTVYKLSTGASPKKDPAIKNALKKS